MVNIKKLDFYDVITGDSSDGKNYGVDTSIFRRADNIDMIFDSRGSYLGIRICRGKFIDGKYTGKKGIYDFKSFMDLKIWAGGRCFSGSNDLIRIVIE